LRYPFADRRDHLIDGDAVKEKKEFHMPGFTGVNNIVIQGVKTTCTGQRAELEANGIALYNAAMALEGLWTGQAHTEFLNTMAILKKDLENSLTNLDGMMGHVNDVQDGFQTMDAQYARMLRVN
jgi:uncharacterized protein YukE